MPTYIWHLIIWGEEFCTMEKKFFPPIPNPTIALFLPNARKVYKMLFTRANIFVVAFTGERNLSDQVHTGGPPCLLTFQNSSRFCFAKLIQRPKRFQELPVISISLLRWGGWQNRCWIRQRKRGEGLQLFSRGKRWYSSQLIRRVGSGIVDTVATLQLVLKLDGL